MKRVRKASDRVYRIKSCACDRHQASVEQTGEHLSQEEKASQQSQQEGDSFSTRLMDRFFTLSFDILAIVGFDGYFKRLSNACERILGFHEDELLAVPLLEFIHPNDRAATIAVVQTLTAGNQVEHFENRYRCKDGSYKWLSWSGVGGIEEKLIYCTARDITDRKQAEETLQKSNQYYETILHSLNGIVWEFDLQAQQFLFVSDKAEEILGYPIEQWLTEPYFWESHIYPEDREWVVEGCRQLVLKQQEGQLEYRMVAVNGRIVWMQNIISLVIEANQTIKLRGVLLDITEAHQTKETLHRREQEFRALVENSPDVITRIDRNFRYLYANPKIEERTGIPAAEYLGKTSTELEFPRELVTLWENTAQQVFDTHQEQWMEFEIDSPSGRIFNHSRLVPEFAADGSVESVLVVIRTITEHKQLERALQESEARFQAFMQHSPAATWVVDADGRLLQVSPYWLKMVRLSAKEAIGKTLFDIFPAELAQQYIDNNHQVLQSNQVSELIESAPLPDGTIGEYLVYKFPIEGPDERTLVGGIAVDITELKRTEAALRQSEARYRILASHFPNSAVLLFDRDLRYVLADGTELEVMGLSKAGVEGRTIWEVLPPETCEFVEPFYRATLEGVSSVVEVQFAGQVYLVHYLPIQNEDEQLAVGMVMAQNMTQRKRAEAKLRESEERFRQIAESIREVFWVADIELTHILYVSPAYEEIWGRTCQSLYEQPKSFVEAVHPEDKCQVIAILEQQRQTGFSHEYRIVKPDGSIRWIWERAFSVNDSAGNPYRVVGVSQDITDRKQAEEALQLADFSFDRSALAAVWIGSDARILRVNAGSCQMLGYSREELQSKYVYELDPNFHQESWAGHWQMLQQQKTMTFTSKLRCKDGKLLPIETTLNYLEFNGKEYNFAFARDISERLQAEVALRYQREQEQLVVSIAHYIRQSLNLEEILSKTVIAVREFLQSDRVLIYYLEPEVGGRVIAESVGEGWVTASGAVIHDCYFSEVYAQLYQQGRVQAVDDIYTAGLTPCHVDLLAQFQVKANLAVPIAQDDQLWGLLVVQQCDAPRQWQLLETHLLRQLATQVAIAIQQSELYQQAQTELAQRQQAEIALRQQAERERLLATTAQRIRQSLDLRHVLDTTVTEVRHLLQADRVLLYQVGQDGVGRVITESVATDYLAILDQTLPPEIFPEDYHDLYRQGRIRRITDVETDDMAPCLAETLRQFQVRSKLVVPILQGEDLWGLLIAHQCSYSREWQAQEVNLLQQLATQVAIAMQQSELYQQAQAEIAQRQLAEAALRQQAEHERLIADITNRIRRSLDLDDVLSVMVEEVRQVLNADRVLVFRLHSDGSGSVVKESVLPEYPVTKEMRWLDECFPADCYEFYRQGRARIVSDVKTDDWGACLTDFMLSVGVKSKVVAPIVQTSEESSKPQVWGLLIVHACAYQRVWQSIEADFLEHLTGKLAIAIQQAELHQQVQQLNTNLEIQVQERTLELQQSLEFEALLKRITDKVRDSLDEAQILQTVVQELAIGLKVQCCDAALYDLDQEVSIICFEHSTAEILVTKGQVFPFTNLSEVYNQLVQGQYVQFGTITDLDFWKTQALPQFTILSCPMVDDQSVLGDLWLFRPRKETFNTLEVRLVEQVANQCAIALRQSRLYQAAQAQVTELERLNRLKDDFLSTVSHELRTPMANIKMAIQMLEVMQARTEASNSQLDLSTNRYFTILKTECQREISLINDLLDLTRLDAGDEPLNLSTIDLQIWIPHVLEPFEHRVINQRQQLHIFIPTTLPPITTDLSYLERVLTELLNNACKYTPPEEQIKVTVEARSAERLGTKRTNCAETTILTSYFITVSNSGVEIPPAELDRIFDKFYRIPNNDPWKHGGTGLGLALVKRLIDKLNGTIEVRSQHNQTSFIIQLPL